MKLICESLLHVKQLEPSNMVSIKDEPDNFGTVLFVNGVNGEGARRGSRGRGAAVGEFSGKSASTLLSIMTEPLR